jgi:hypothetical protein
MQVSFWLCESNQNTTEPEVVKRQAHNMEAHSTLSLMGIGLLAGGVCFQLWAIENCRWLLITFIEDSL